RRYLDQCLSFQTAVPQFRLEPDDEKIHFSKRSIPRRPPVRSGNLQAARSLDCGAPTFCYGREFQYGALSWVHALAIAPDLQRVRERKSTGALDPSRDT